MAQLSRAIRRAFLELCPPGLRRSLLETHPNLRKAAPAGLRFVFGEYLGDISVHIDTAYKVERIMWTGEYEPPLVRFLEAHHTAGWTALDVGANVGAIALVLAKFAGPAGKLFAFEPGPPNFERLRNNFALNPTLAARAELIASGVSDTPGELWWAEEPGNPGNALLAQSGSHRIPVTTLDVFFADRPLDRLDFVKIDVEGMELEVMRGASGLLRRFHPVLYFETLPRYINSGRGASFGEIERLLASELGYRLYRLSNAGKVTPLDKGRPGGYTLAIHPDNPLAGA